MLFTVTGWISQFIGYGILVLMVFVTGWTAWRWYRDVQQTIKDGEAVRAQVGDLQERLRKADQGRKEIAAQNEALTAENERLEEEPRKTKKERDELRAGQRQKRIEDWRSVIRGFDFDTHSFASTDTYAQMRPHLQPKVVKMFEAQRTVHIGNETRGDTAYGYTLLDEVARIEKEWGLI